MLFQNKRNNYNQQNNLKIKKMSNNKFKFDPTTLKYQEVDTRKHKIIKLIISLTVSIIIVTFVLYVAFAYLIETPKQKSLKKENKKLEEQYEYLSTKYEQTEKVLEELKKRDDNIYRAIFEAEPPVENADMIDFTRFDTITDVDLVNMNSSSINNILTNIRTNRTTYTEFLEFFQQEKDKLNNIPAIQPIINTDLKKVIYGFGNRIDPVYKTPSFHSGIDFAAPKGTQVFATADGTVKRANDKIRGLGKHIRIDHGNGFETLYSHLSEMDVRRRQKVKRGDIIGYVGNTGKSLVSHLHYEIHYNNEPVNPIHFFFLELAPKQYSKIVKASSRSGISLD